MATLRTPKKIPVKRGRKTAAPLFVAIYVKGSVRDEEQTRVTGEFKNSGANLIWLQYAQGFSDKPRIERMSR